MYPTSNDTTSTHVTEVYNAYNATIPNEVGNYFVSDDDSRRRSEGVRPQEGSPKKIKVTRPRRKRKEP